jgi:uncharacterized protein YgiM (DUF1202 family)
VIHLKVVKAHVKSYPEGVQFREGEKVTVGKEDTDTPGWFDCIRKGGQRAWVPRDYLSGTRDQAWITEDYNSAEMTVKEGDEVEPVKTVRGWVLCRRGGETGWIPEVNLA